MGKESFTRFRVRRASLQQIQLHCLQGSDKVVTSSSTWTKIFMTMWILKYLPFTFFPCLKMLSLSSLDHKSLICKKLCDWLIDMIPYKTRLAFKKKKSGCCSHCVLFVSLHYKTLLVLLPELLNIFLVKIPLNWN